MRVVFFYSIIVLLTVLAGLFPASTSYGADVAPVFPATITGGDEAVKADVYNTNGKNRLATDPNFTAIQNPGVPTFSNNLRSIYADVNIALNPSTYTTIYSYSGSGKFCSFIIDYDKVDVITRIVIDGDTIFDLSSASIDSIQIPNTATVTFMGTIGGPWYDVPSKKVGYKPAYPIVYSTSVLIEAKETADVVVDQYIVTLTQE
jgi:uncharacterized protein (UPF0333 family)